MLPDHPAALNNLAWTYQLRGDKRAREMAQRAYLKAPGPDSADTLGWILLGEGEAAAALPLLQQAGSARPSDPAVQYHWAAALRAGGRAAEAAPDPAGLVAEPPAVPRTRKEAERLLRELSAAAASVMAPGDLGRRRRGRVEAEPLAVPDASGRSAT